MEYKSIYHYEHKQAIKKAHSLVNQAVDKGWLIKPEKCTYCRQSLRLEGHHEDYNKPLVVIWLCRNCHIFEHKTLDVYNGIRPIEKVFKLS